MDSDDFEYTSMKNLNESKYGFWGLLARKAKAFIDEDDGTHKFENHARHKPQTVDNPTGRQFQQSYRPNEGSRKAEAPFRKSSDTIASSLNHIGGTIKNALEGGLTIVENRTADIIQETRKLNIRRKGNSRNAQNQAPDRLAPHNFPHVQADLETQLKASRDVANAMAAKAKLLLRELKTVKADLAFAKERCAQLEEENKILRESYQKGASTEDDDLIRLQLETLLAEKGRLAHENSVYARENRFLREIVEYHQLTMQDVIYVDEGIEEVTEVFSPSPNQILSRTNSISNSNLSHGAALSFGPPSPAALIVSSPSPRKPPEIVVPEACPIIPMPPTPSPQSYRDHSAQTRS